MLERVPSLLLWLLTRMLDIDIDITLGGPILLDLIDPARLLAQVLVLPLQTLGLERAAMELIVSKQIVHVQHLV